MAIFNSCYSNEKNTEESNPACISREAPPSHDAFYYDLEASADSDSFIVFEIVSYVDVSTRQGSYPLGASQFENERSSQGFSQLLLPQSPVEVCHSF